MSVLKRVDIVGNEIHGSRYRDAALFYPTVETTAYNDFNFVAYDTIILAEPYFWSDGFAERLVSDGFCGLLVLEKMPVCSWEDFVRFLHKEYPFHICHAMLRLFEDQILNTEIERLKVQWPNLVGGHMSRTRHTLPNALLFCRAQLDMGTETVKKITSTNHSLNVTLADEKHYMELEIYDTNDIAACVQVNNSPLRWPNYMQLIHRLFDTLLGDSNDWRTDGAIIGEIIKVVELSEK